MGGGRIAKVCGLRSGNHRKSQTSKYWILMILVVFISSLGPPLQEACLKLLRSHVLHHAAAWTYKEINEQDLNAKVSCG